MTTTSHRGLSGTPHESAAVHDPVGVTLVELPDCHLCEQAKETLRVLGRDFPLRVTVLEAASAEGQRLVSRFRPTMAPLVLVDGELFSSGRLPRGRLVSRLRARGVGGGR